MSRVKELIEQFCSDGVQWKTLGDIAEFKYGFTDKAKGKGNARFVRITDIDERGNLRSSDARFIDLSNENHGYRLKRGDILLARTGATYGKTMLFNEDYDAVYASFLIRIRFVEPDILPSYYWHFAQSSFYWEQAYRLVGGGAQPQFNANVLKLIKIPIPPVEIQNEIVSILDKFTLLEAELEAELEARKTQYEHYRDVLLRFEAKNVEWKTLGEIGEFTRGKRFVKTDILSEGVPCIHYGEMYTHYKIWAKEAKSFLDPVLAAKLRVAKPGDVVIVAAGETIEDIGQGLAWLGESDVVIHDACFAFSHDMHPNYVSHFLQTDLFHSQIRRHISSGKISSINASGLSKAKIPVPPMEEQKRIAAILDKFHVLINDISVGIPAEIAGRRQQYEYYRNKLLTFKNVANG